MNWFDLYARIYDPFMELFGLYKPDLIVEHLSPTHDETILDVGGGTGFISNKVSQHAKKVVVLDQSKRMLNIAKRYPLELHHGTAQAMPFKNDQFDSVMCVDALHHIKDIDAALNEFNRVLKKKGKVLIYEFDIKGFRGLLFWLFEKIYIDNSRFIKPEALKAKMESHGFKGQIIRISHLQYLFIGTKR
ncbi:MAG: class I SAM-dependent methyltransferase [Nanobdellota archaeon]